MGKDWGPEAVSPSSLIQVGGTNFASMRDVSELNALQDSAPAWHHRTLNAIKASGKVRGPEAETEFVQAPRQRMLTSFGMGAKVRDNEKGRKGIIIQAKAGYTKKSKTPVHRIADSKGNSWLAKQTDLSLIL